MSRNDGKFPHIPKLDIDPEVWPENYWNHSVICTECEMAWPTSHLFQPSVCCDAKTHVADCPPDMRWPEAVSQLLTKRFEKAYDAYNDGASDEELVIDDVTISQAVEQLIEESNHPSTPASASSK